MADRGILGDQPVLDVHERDGVIAHLLAHAVTEGETVSGTVDSIHRLDMMQQHSGEHIFSGLICRRHSCDNVGFHIGPEELTVDFNKPLTAADVEEAELLANQVIWQNIPVRAWFPDTDELAALDYRSKKELTGAVRIVAIEGADTCACCGTHVAYTGSIGQIKVTDCRNYKSGVRITLKCGMRALREANTRQRECRDISHATNGKLGSLDSAVNRLLSERDTLKALHESLAMTLFQAQAANETGDVRLVVAPDLPASLFRKAVTVLAQGARYAVVLSPRDGAWNIALSSASEDVRPVAKALTSVYGGKAGGPKELVQGMLDRGTPADIRKVLEIFQVEGSVNP